MARGTLPGCFWRVPGRISEANLISSKNIDKISTLTLVDRPHEKQVLFWKSRLHRKSTQSISEAFAMPFGHVVNACGPFPALSIRQITHLLLSEFRQACRCKMRVTASLSVTMVDGIAKIWYIHRCITRRGLHFNSLIWGSLFATVARGRCFSWIEMRSSWILGRVGLASRSCRHTDKGADGALVTKADAWKHINMIYTMQNAQLYLCFLGDSLYPGKIFVVQNIIWEGTYQVRPVPLSGLQAAVSLQLLNQERKAKQENETCPFHRGGHWYAHWRAAGDLKRSGGYPISCWEGLKHAPVDGQLAWHSLAQCIALELFLSIKWIEKRPEPGSKEGEAVSLLSCISILRMLGSCRAEAGLEVEAVECWLPCALHVHLFICACRMNKPLNCPNAELERKERTCKRFSKPCPQSGHGYSPANRLSCLTKHDFCLFMHFLTPSTSTVKKSPRWESWISHLDSFQQPKPNFKMLCSSRFHTVTVDRSTNMASWRNRCVQQAGYGWGGSGCRHEREWE